MNNTTKVTKTFTSIYSSLQFEYFMVYGSLATFASVFLLPLGYSNGDVGMILGTSYLISVLIQPFLADYADQSGKVSQLLIITNAMIMALCVSFFFIPAKSAMLTLCYIAALSIHLAIPPLLNQLNYAFEHVGIVMNFGLARAVGSIGFSLMSYILGELVEQAGLITIPICNQLGPLLMILSLLLLNRYYLSYTKGMDFKEKEIKKEESRITLKEFVKGHKKLLVLNIGIVFLIFHNCIYTTYMYQIIGSVGGGTVEMGKALGIMALIEVPSLMMYEKLHKRFTSTTILKASLFGFLIKNVWYVFAGSVTHIYFAQICQLIGFGLFTPAIVNYIHERTYKAEETKGQALFSSMYTTAGILGNYVGGHLIDIYGVHYTLLVCCIMTLIGVTIIYSMADRVTILKK